MQRRRGSTCSKRSKTLAAVSVFEVIFVDDSVVLLPRRCSARRAAATLAPGGGARRHCKVPTYPSTMAAMVEYAAELELNCTLCTLTLTP